MQISRQLRAGVADKKYAEVYELCRGGSRRQTTQFVVGTFSHACAGLAHAVESASTSMSAEHFNWIVPLRRAVVKKKTTYQDFTLAWLRSLAIPGKTLSDNAYVLWRWYSDPKDGKFTAGTYNSGVALLRRWRKLTFSKTPIATSSVGTTRIQTSIPNFHARLWKGPKRVLLEQAAGEDEAQLAELRPYDLVGGRVQLQFNEDGSPKPVELFPGDVLEAPLHVFLDKCGQTRFADLDFDPVGSFYLGTSVRSKSGVARTKTPKLHDNLLAMRYQLVHALNMANCYHDASVYTEENKIYGARHSPEGAGVYARGMPFGGTPSVNLRSMKGPAQHNWEVTQLNTNRPEEDRPICMPTRTARGEFLKLLPP